MSVVLPDDPEVTDPLIDAHPTSPKPWGVDGDNRNVKGVEWIAPLATALRHPGHALDAVCVERAEAKAYVSPLRLTYDDRLGARKAWLRACYLGLKNAAAMHYTEGAERWSGITDDRRSIKGEYPSECDCSAFSTWGGWDATRWKHLPDFMNACSWRAGYTGTLCANGVRVDESALLTADLVFYGGSLSVPSHVAVYVGNGRVISQGSEIGPLLLPVHYRSDVTQFRRYIR